MNVRLHCRKTLIGSAVAATLAAALGAPSVVWAQTADATLRGKAAANAAITARNVATGATRRTTADDDGSYTLVGMPPGTYKVDAGAGTETTVTLSVASVATLDLVAEAAPPTTTTLEDVIITAKRPVEVKTSEVGTTISQEQIQNVPQITRNFLEFADTAPGMVFSVDSGGNTSLRSGGQTTSSTNVFIDGVGQKSYVKEGGVSGQFATQGNPFPQLSIGSYKVITSNYKAEYDQISSAAITAETKSGTNEFHGEVLGDYTSSSLRAETPSEANSGTKADSNDKEYSLAFGGPIIQDKMHFFVNYEGKRYTTPVAVTPGVQIVGGDVTALLPADVAAQFGPASRPFTENLFFGKVDFEPTDRDRFEASSNLRFEHQIDNVGNTTADAAGIDVKNFDKRFAVRWQHSADRWFNEVLATYENAFNAPQARGTGNGALYTALGAGDQLIIDTGPAGAGAVQNKGQKGVALQDDITLSNLNWLGDHTVKMGAKYKSVKLTAADAEDINPQFYYDVDATGTYTTAPYKVFFANAVPGESPVAVSTNKQLGVYFQDDWATSDKLTLNLGVRWDYEKTPSYLDYVTPANVADALRNGQDPNAPAGVTYAQQLALGGVNVNDYISNGHNRKAQTDEIQPRLGFSYDLKGDQAHVIYGGAGRAYDRDLYDYLQVEQTKSSLPEYNILFNQPQHPCTLAAGQCVAWDPAYLTDLDNLRTTLASSNAGKEVDAINNHLKAPYSDQFSIGIRNKVGDWNTSAAVARILSYDGLVFTLGNRYPSGAFWVNGGQPWGDGIPGFGSFIIGNNGIETHTTQVLLSAERPFTEENGWGATVAYTYSHATDNHDINDHYSFDEETIKQYPWMPSNGVAKHRLVATGTIKGPWTMIFSGKVTLSTPIPFYGVAFYGATLPTGSNGTPIATKPGNTIGYKSIDLQATKNFDIHKDMQAYVRADLLNIANWHNYSDAINNYGSGGVLNPDPTRYNPTGNITGVPRTFKISAGFRF